MKVSPHGVLEIAGHEGIVPAPYLDSVGVWTYGVGHTAAAGAPDPSKMARGMPEDLDATLRRALALFDKDLDRYEARVNKAVTAPLKQHEFDALVSFDFNTGGIHRAELTKAINRGDPNAYKHFMGWLRPPEIRGRRTAEMNLFRTGIYSNKPVPVWRVDERGKLRGILKSVAASDLLRLMGGASHKPRRQSPWMALLMTLAGVLAKVFGG